MRSTAAVPLMLLVLASLGGCDQLQQPRVVYILQSAGVVEAVDDPQGIAGPIRYTLSGGDTIEVRPGEALGGSEARVGSLLLHGQTPTVWSLPVSLNDRNPNLPAGCFSISGNNQKKTIDGQDVVEIRLTTDSPESWLRLRVAPDFAGFVGASGEVGGGSMCLNENGEVFSAPGT
jgi:hypothetical protein